MSTAERKFEHPALGSPLDEIVVRLKPGASGEEASGLIRELLDRLHAGAADYELVVPEALLAESRRTQRLFNMVMGAIAGISLLVGGIGIMNIMLATVLERTREIGVRRAVGARSRDIRFQFIVESFAISLIGGVTGIVAGLALARGVAAVAGWETIVTGSFGDLPGFPGGGPGPYRSAALRVKGARGCFALPRLGDAVLKSSPQF